MNVVNVYVGEHILQAEIPVGRYDSICGAAFKMIFQLADERPRRYVSFGLGIAQLLRDGNDGVSIIPPDRAALFLHAARHSSRAQAPAAKHISLMTKPVNNRGKG